MNNYRKEKSILLTEISMEELREKLHRAHQRVGEILAEIRARERKRLFNLGKITAEES